MNNATLFVAPLSNLDMFSQIGDLKEIVEAAANAFHQISMFSVKLINSTSLPGPEISGILQLAQEHRMLSESALQHTATNRNNEVSQ